MRGKKAAGSGALVAAIKRAHREVKATWAEAREDAQRLSVANGTDELEAAIRLFLRSHVRLVRAGERLKKRLARFRKARNRSGDVGRKRSRKP